MSDGHDTNGMGEAGTAPLPAAEPVFALTPVQRLAQSRERLRQVLAPPPGTESGAAGAGTSWEERLRAVPGLAFAVDVVQAWWQQHPLRAAALVAREVSRAALRPIAGRHPIALMAAAVMVGAALAWTRPWRWALKSALFAGLLPQLASRLASALPIEDWIKVLGSVIGGARPPAASEPEAAAAAAAASAAVPAASPVASPVESPTENTDAAACVAAEAARAH